MAQLVGESLYEHLNFSNIEFGEEAGIKLAEAIEQDFNKRNLNEAVGMLVLSSVLAAPAFVKMLGWIIKKGSKMIKWEKGEDKGKQLQHWAHGVEKTFQQPINWILKKIGVTDDEKREKWSKGIFALVIILLGIYSGIAAAEAYKAANIGHAAGEGLLTGLKAGETGETLLNAVKAAGVTAAKSAH